MKKSHVHPAFVSALAMFSPAEIEESELLESMEDRVLEARIDQEHEDYLDSLYQDAQDDAELNDLIPMTFTVGHPDRFDDMEFGGRHY